MAVCATGLRDTCKEIEKLKEICGQHEAMMAVRKEKEQCGYFARKLDMLQDRRKIQESQDKIPGTGSGTGESGPGCGCRGNRNSGSDGEKRGASA